ncbi:MAG: response regulator transcription factor [Bacteroidales bacterium]|nr:response regulator transcription factor [Bacteroidales bacterium]
MRRYIIADNHELTRFALQSLLKRDGNVVVTAVNRAELVELLKEYEDAIVILDYTLFDFQDEEQLLIISERFSMASWILLSDDLPKAFLKKVIYASHAFSVVFKDEPIKEISYAIQSVADGKRYVSQCATEILLSQQQEKEKPAVLTATETEIVKAIALGRTTKEIANERFSSVHTINTHRKNIFRKLGINTVHEVVKYALRAGLIDAAEFYI